MASELVRLFLEAVRVDAPSLKERPMADFIRRSLSALPVDVREDDSARLFGGECGNILCVPRDFDASRPAVALVAHMDTPRSTAAVQPVVSAERITSDGTTALGVDNRAGASILLHALREHLHRQTPGNAVIVFTAAEEAGPFGSRHLDLTPYNVRICFVFDCARRPGTYIQSAAGASMYSATFHGRSSHAGVAPENGAHAIRMAARAISRIPMGRLSPTMTSNVGSIAGGTATNVVPERCTVEGEVREFDANRIQEHLDLLQSVFRKAADELGGRVEFASRTDFAPFRLDPASPVVRMTEGVLSALGLEPRPIEYTGGSDANMLNARGLPTVNLGIGAQNPHGNDEFILIEDLHTSAVIARELIARSSTLH